MMKKLLLFLVSAAICLATFGQRAGGHNSPAALIPQPVSVVKGNDFFTGPANLPVIISGHPELKTMAQRFARQLSLCTDTEATIKEGKGPAAGSIFLSVADDKTIPAEGYRLQVTTSGISIHATGPAGIFYGLQTLLQMLPAYERRYDPEEIGYDSLRIRASAIEEHPRIRWYIRETTIEDYPRFGWRGLMLDVARHFFTKKQVMDFIDDMVKYKFNILHWHLSDDQGWRIEIKSLPQLTAVGAWRVDKTGTFGGFSPPAPDEPRTYGGYYTQEDIKEIVQYAKERYVNILPEIDVPGHSMAAIAAYPELTCTPGTYAVNSGEQLMVWPAGGHFYGLKDNSLCPANEKVYEFLDKVFTELAQLFPFDYIHMGGDETARNFWEKSEAIRTLMQRENLKNLDEVQSYFVKRVEKIISAKGKKLIGWDEILDGGLAPNAAVMSWRGLRGGIEAAKQGHEVVMSPTDFAYLDYMQGDAIIEPPVYASLRLKKAYQFEPLPDGIDARLVKGGQANIWTEHIYNMRHLQYMVWPRGMAIAEVLWSPKEKRNWDDFARRVEYHFDRFERAGINYSPSIYDPIFGVSKTDSAQLIVNLSTEIKGLDIHYSFDNSFPDEYYPKYTAPLAVPKDATTLKVITYRSRAPKGRMITMPVAELKRRAGIAH